MSTLKDQTISGMIWSTLERFGTLGISFVTNLILARLLSPDDFGAIGLLAIFILLSNTFIDGGFGAALIQKSNTTSKDYSTIFFWNVILAFLLYLLLFLTSPVIASYFHLPILEKVLKVQSIILITNSLGVVHISIIRKELKFRKLTIAYFFPMLISAIISIYLAYRGIGIWSLVVLQLVNSVLQVVFLWTLNPWRPSMEFDLQSFKGLFSYGGFLLLSNLINTFCDNFQGILIGRKFSSSTMGFYTQAKKLEEIPTITLTTITTQVTFPVFSKIKDNKESFLSAHRNCLQALNIINIPLMSFLLIAAEPLIIILYSEKWASSVLFFQILCIGGLANCLQSVNYSVFIASGRSKQMFKWNIIKRLIGIVLMFVGVYWGVIGLLVGMVISNWITYIINALLANKITGYSLLQQAVDVSPIFGISIVSSLITFFLGMLFSESYIEDLVVKVLIFVSCFILLCLLLKIKSFKLLVSIVSPYLTNISNKIKYN